MLSILIPTYNYNVFPLASKIHEQAIKAKIDFEIICFDDGSNAAINIENQKINTLSNSKFSSLEKNVGLSNNRNALAEASKHQYLLFIDGDSMLVDDYFITNYLNALKEEIDVIYGGRIHPEQVDNTRKLRWKYGKFCEDVNVSQRNKHLYKSVFFNNTFIKKSVFNKIKFEKSITQYGHEDTIFAYKLSTINARILHINNPILHDDVDFNAVYFNKTHKSLENLHFIYKTNSIDPQFITFLKVFINLKKFKLHYLFAWVHIILYPVFKRNLTSNYPSLHVFDLFRLSYFCHINLKN